MTTVLMTTAPEPEMDTPHKEDTSPEEPKEDTAPEPTTRVGWHARLVAWVKDHPKLAALLMIAL